MPASVSSLLRSASANRKRQISLEDDLASYEWQTSAQTQEDWEKYQTHLESRSTLFQTDPSKVISYQRQIDTGRRAFTSNEIQRSAIDVLEGNAQLEDKQSTVLRLYKQAVSVGDLNLATNLRQQFDQIDTAIQRRDEANATKMRGFAEDMASHQVTTLEDLAKSYLEGDDPAAYKDPNRIPSNKQLTKDFTKYGSDFFNDTLKRGDSTFNVWDFVYANTTAAISALQQAAQIATSEGKASALYDRAAKLNNGETKITFGGVSLSINEINDVRDAARNGQNMFQPAKNSKGENILIKNKVTDYVWARDTNGNPRIVTTYNQKEVNYGTIKDPKTGKVVRESVEQRLKDAGYEVMGKSPSGLLTVRQTTNARDTTPIPGSTLGESFEVALDQNGNVRMISEPQDPNDPNSRKIFEINLDRQANNFGKINEVDLAGETFFPDASIRSAGSSEGRDYINKLLHPEAMRPVDIQGTAGNQFALQGEGENTSALNGMFGGIGGILLRGQNAEVRKQNDLRLQKATAQTLQTNADYALQSNVNGNALNLNVPAGARLSVNNSGPPTSPLKVLNTPDPRTVTVAKPAPLPNITVAKPTPLPNLTVNNSPASNVKLRVL